MKRVLTHWIAPLLLLVVFNSCGNNNNEQGPTDTLLTGTINISADESFKPVLDSEIQVFQSLNPKARIKVQYKPEAECLKDLAVDSIRIVIATRSFSKFEQNLVQDSLHVAASQLTVAYDAIAVIVNPESTDTTFTMQQLKDLLTGRSTKKLLPVFDGLSATSTVRFVMDSVLRGQPLSPNVRAAQSSEGVIDYVSKTKDAVGFIGVSWVGNPQDSTQLSYLDRIRVAGIEHPLKPSVFVTPAQYNIYYRRYPLVRDLVVNLKESHNGLGHGFLNYLTTQSGQLIFNRAFLMPARMNFAIRSASLKR